MNIEARKIRFKQKFLNLQSEDVISKLEKVLQKESKHPENKKAEPFSDRELNNRIDKSMDDSKNDRVTEVNDLLDEIDKWT